MSTPTTITFPTIEPAALAEALQKEREVQTPDLDYFVDLEHDYKYECEQEHQILHPTQIDRFRDTITDIKYHQIEIDWYHQLYIHTVQQRLLQRHKINGEHTLDGLKKIKHSYKRSLASIGVTGNILKEKRMDISDQNYWKLEAELLQQKASLRQRDILVKLARKHAKAKASSASKKAPLKSTRRSSRIASRRSGG